MTDRSADTDTTDDCGTSFVALFLAALGSWLARRHR